MKLTIATSAVKELASLPQKDAQALLAKLQQVAADPNGQFPWAKRLTNHPGFRARHGDWRAISRLDHSTDDMIVDKIAKRDEVYR